MSDPTVPPSDPDAGLSDEQKVQRDQIKSWVKDAFKDGIKELREENPPDAPERTKGPKTKDDSAFSIFGSLFGGQ